MQSIFYSEKGISKDVIVSSCDNYMILIDQEIISDTQLDHLLKMCVQ